MRAPISLLSLCALTAIVSCDPATTEPSLRAGAAARDAATSDDLVFVRFAPEAPPSQRDTSFWAVKGEDRELVLYYEAEDGTPGELTTRELLEFRVPGDALLSRPDGTLFEPGDSVEISVRIDEGDRFIFSFAPAGLRFSTEDPALLSVSYAHAEADLNGDGVIDDHDVSLEGRLQIWKREVPDAAWVRQETEVDSTDDKAKVTVPGFTSFALASS